MVLYVSLPRNQEVWFPHKDEMRTVKSQSQRKMQKYNYPQRNNEKKVLFFGPKQSIQSLAIS